MVLIRNSCGRAFAPPGMNVGPKGIRGEAATTQKLVPSGTNPEKAGYPPGYRPIQHGEAGGTAANFKPAGEIRPVDGRSQAGVEPGDTWDSERLVVAAQADKQGVGLC